jgi:hypothetical protein
MVMVGHSKRLAEPLTRGQRRGLAVALVVLLLAVAGAIAYGVAHRNGTYDVSRNGCVNLTLPSTVGGVLIHQCGAAAKALCAQAQVQSDPTSRLLRPECAKAGLAPARVGS